MELADDGRLCADDWEAARINASLYFSMQSVIVLLGDLVNLLAAMERVGITELRDPPPELHAVLERMNG